MLRGQVCEASGLVSANKVQAFCPPVDGPAGLTLHDRDVLLCCLLPSPLDFLSASVLTEARESAQHRVSLALAAGLPGRVCELTADGAASCLSSGGFGMPALVGPPVGRPILRGSPAVGAGWYGAPLTLQ